MVDLKMLLIVLVNKHPVMYAVLAKCRKHNLPIDLQVDYFNKPVMPIMTYGSEVSGFEKLSVLNALHIKFLKYVLCVNMLASNYKVYGELAQLSLELIVKRKC